MRPLSIPLHFVTVAISGSQPPPFHVVWSCPANSAFKDAAVSGSQYLIKDATQGAEDLPCLWLRGLLPQHCISDLIPASIVESVCLLGTLPPPLWPSGLYYTDGAGGRDNKWSDLRQCGCGIACVANDAKRFTVLCWCFLRIAR